MIDKSTLILCVFLIGIIPLFTFGFDLIEDSDVYRIIFGFVEIDNFINERFSAEYEELKLQNETNFQIYLEREHEPNEFEQVLKFIKSHSSVLLPDKTPYFITVILPTNPLYVRLPDGYHVLIQEESPIVISYCKTPPCASDLIIPIDSMKNFKRWYSDDKDRIRNTLNLLLTFTSIGLGFWSVRKDIRRKGP